MLLASDGLSKEVTEFRGPQLRLDPYAIPPTYALAAQNVEYLRGQVKTRFGHSLLATVDTDTFASLVDWLAVNKGDGVSNHFLVGYAPAVGVRSHKFTSGTLAPTGTTLMAVTGAAGACLLGAGTYLYATFFDTVGRGFSQGHVCQQTAGLDDALFPRPPKATEISISLSAGGVNSGSMASGLRRFGFYLVSRSGYATKLGPLDGGGGFAPSSITLANNDSVSFTVTPAGAFTWSGHDLVYGVMSLGANQNRYFTMPVGGGALPSGVTPVTFTATTSDGDIEATQTDVTLQQTLLCQANDNSGPFSPRALFVYGSRMGWVGVDSAHIPVCYFSEPNSYQTITAAQHGVYLPGFADIVCGFTLRGVAYLLGPHHTYSTADNGGVPATWATPQLVDGAIGTLAPRGVTVGASQGYAWIVDQGGLYLFMGGQYPERPISYYQQTDWDRINWTAAATVQVIDDKDAKRVFVKVPLDGSSTPTHLMVFDYADGVAPEQVKYSLDQIGGGFAMGAIALVGGATASNADGLSNMALYVGGNGNSKMLRRNRGTEANPYRDDASGFTSLYEFGLLPGQDAIRGTVHSHDGDHIRVRGAGNLALTVYSLDHARSVTPLKSPLALSTAPGLEYLAKYSLLSEQCSLAMQTSALDAWFLLTKLTHYYTEHVLQR